MLWLLMYSVFACDMCCRVLFVISLLCTVIRCLVVLLNRITLSYVVYLESTVALCCAMCIMLSYTYSVHMLGACICRYMDLFTVWLSSSGLQKLPMSGCFLYRVC